MSDPEDERKLGQWDRTDIMEAAILGGLVAAHENTKAVIEWYLNGAKKGEMPDFPIKQLFDLAKNLNTDASGRKYRTDP